MSPSQTQPSHVIENGHAPPAGCRPLAICGMALRLPGGISSPSQFWDFLLAKGDARSRVPESRYKVSSYYSEFDRYATTKTDHGYFLDESVDLGALDTSFFSFTKHELEYIDPQQRQLLEVVRECFESAGEVAYQGKNIGCYVGSFGDDWIEILFHDQQMYGKYTLMIGGDYALANRISYEYDLRGPNMSIRTACSSALVSLHEACHAIERGDCAAAIVAGCNLIMSPTMTMILSAKGVLSPDGSCKTFDAAANGYSRGEAINAIYIKPLDDALRDGNPIRAIIRATAVNSDGKLSGVTAPSVEAHEGLIRKAYSAAGIDDIPQTALVECHGTGTAVGDPVEVQGIANTFGKEGVYIGSVKPNVGHSEGASGLTSLIKAVLALEHHVIPPNIKFTTPNPKIPFCAMNLKVPTEPTPWPRDRCLRASVNAFGMGGVNAHAILESAETFVPLDVLTAREEQPQTPVLLLHSANTLKSLERLVEKCHEYLRSHSQSLKHLAYTLATRREHLQYRAVSIVDGELSLATTSPVKIPSPCPKVVMVFTGQGAQWPRMGVQLYETYQVFRSSISRADAVLHSLPDAPEWFISHELLKDVKSSNVHKPSYAQPLCTAIQIALVDLVRSCRVTPFAVVGHSSGEIGAAYAAGILDSEQAVIAAYYRGMVTEQITRSGGMAVLGMAMEDAQHFLKPGVVVACENSPSNVTISGNEDALDQVMQAVSVSRPETLVRRLKVDVAYHSDHMKQVGDAYFSRLKGCLDDGFYSQSSQVLFFSTVTGHVLQEGGAVGAQYWQSNLESPVLFHTAIKNILAHATRTSTRLLFLEVGPHSALSGPIREILDSASPRHDKYVSCLVRFEDSVASLLSALGQMFCQNIDMDFNLLTNQDKDARVLPDLPTYCWDHGYSSRYMPRENKEWLWCQHPKHELLGIRVLDSTHSEPCWRNVLHLEHVPWLRDHKVGGVIVFPAAGYISMVGAALAQINTAKGGGFCVVNMTLSTAMVLKDENSIEILTSLHRHQQAELFEFVVSSHDGTGWTRHCRGRVRSDFQLTGSMGQALDQETLHRSLVIPSWYQRLARVGLDYGAAFQCMSDVSSSTTRPVARAKIISTLDESIYYPVHPTMLDGFFQAVLVAMHKGLGWGFAQPHVPISIQEITINDCALVVNVHVWITESGGDHVAADGEAFGEDGRVVLRFKNAVLRSIRVDGTTDEQESRKLARICWRPDIQFQALDSLIKCPPSWEDDTDLLNHLTALCVSQALSRICNGLEPLEWRLRRLSPTPRQVDSRTFYGGVDIRRRGDATTQKDSFLLYLDSKQHRD